MWPVPVHGAMLDFALAYEGMEAGSSGNPQRDVCTVLDPMPALLQMGDYNESRRPGWTTTHTHVFLSANNRFPSH